jgi:hypothetical protein
MRSQRLLWIGVGVTLGIVGAVLVTLPMLATSARPEPSTLATSFGRSIAEKFKTYIQERGVDQLRRGLDSARFVSYLTTDASYRTESDSANGDLAFFIPTFDVLTARTRFSPTAVVLPLAGVPRESVL